MILFEFLKIISHFYSYIVTASVAGDNLVYLFDFV